MIFSFAEIPRFMRVMIINAQVASNYRNSTPLLFLRKSGSDTYSVTQGITWIKK